MEATKLYEVINNSEEIFMNIMKNTENYFNFDEALLLINTVKENRVDFRFDLKNVYWSEILLNKCGVRKFELEKRIRKLSEEEIGFILAQIKGLLSREWYGKHDIEELSFVARIEVASACEIKERKDRIEKLINKKNPS